MEKGSQCQSLNFHDLSTPIFYKYTIHPKFIRMGLKCLITTVVWKKLLWKEIELINNLINWCFMKKKFTLFKPFQIFSLVSASRFCSLSKLTWGNMMSRTAIDLINIVPLGEGNMRKFEWIGPSSFVSKTNARDCK